MLKLLFTVLILISLFRCAFVNFVDREAAELAAQAWANGLEMEGETLGVKWGRSKGASGKLQPASSTAEVAA